MKENNHKLRKAVELILSSKHTTAFTGAGISVESGVPPFRGKDGLWTKYNPIVLDLDYFFANPLKSWRTIKEIFYDFMGDARPNLAHKILAKFEKKNLLQTIITQNIDNLHQKAGSKSVYEFHGNSRNLTCLNCGLKTSVTKEILESLPPKCPNCNNILKPDFIFFGEQIPSDALNGSVLESETADIFILIGTTGEVSPANYIPHNARRNGAKIIEINTKPSLYSQSITDIFLQGKATEVMKKLDKETELN